MPRVTALERGPWARVVTHWWSPSSTLLPFPCSFSLFLRHSFERSRSVAGLRLGGSVFPCRGGLSSVLERGSVTDKLCRARPGRVQAQRARVSVIEFDRKSTAERENEPGCWREARAREGVLVQLRMLRARRATPPTHEHTGDSTLVHPVSATLLLQARPLRAQSLISPGQPTKSASRGRASGGLKLWPRDGHEAPRR